ncbi:STAS domain-containing protein [Micromonospora sp. WMMD1102]|uniref:STAS domain-containing protein n=1 Tax=Micromonospora sp. WMMD1102 TaxID=3016105 RepID=UPI00241531C2|nr:STAS domain-containing protein [Micromonospora sp. WMMD1102]MDG4787844.1 STAS domain-containing protein [Micromonospora sp. WMMD1102]
MQHEPAPPLLVIDPALGRTDIPALCARLVDLLARHPRQGGVVVCDVSRIAAPSAVTVDALARLRLTARRLGVDLRLRAAPVRLRQLLALTGLTAVIPLEGDSTDGSGELGDPESESGELGDPESRSALEPHREAEEREQPLHVEEVGDPPDPAG